jgi:two-component system, NtrC family, nitrogen regulation sensor histidine kinase NtrY
VNRLRNRLILIFLAATLAPVAATLWYTTSLLKLSLSYNSTAELDQVSKSLQRTGHELYQRARESLKLEAAAGRAQPQRYAADQRASWPEAVAEFADGDAPEDFVLAGKEGERLDYLVRHGPDVWVYSTPLGVGMQRAGQEYSRARKLVEQSRGRDLVRGFTYIYVLIAASIWLVSLALLVYLAHRISAPIQQLTAGLSQLAAGKLGTRVDVQRDDEIGRAIQAFNEMAAQLQERTDRLVYLTQLASWQTLARKMAHEVKNSLTPIRLTVEEMVARGTSSERAFLEQAAQIVVDEVEGLERRVRAFSQFAAEPPLAPRPLDVNAVLEDRIGFLKTGHPEVSYEARLAAGAPQAFADEDLVKGILTNLLENAAEAAGGGGRILGVTSAGDGKVAIEVHDSGPGLSEQARKSLFQPTISFKKRGMGLGLSIARKSALLSGGDILLVRGELGGAGFRVLLPVTPNGNQAHPDRG